VTLIASINGSSYGPGYYEFLTNRRPKDGHCKVIPYDDALDPIFDEELINSTAGIGNVKKRIATRTKTVSLVK